jgi:ATP-dependent DNA helicase RecG
MMDEIELLRLIADGETETVEFKREMPRPEHLVREVVALANRQGGYVLLGVGDDARVCGVTLRPGYEEWITNVGAQTIDPPLPLACEKVETTRGKTVLVMRVPRGFHKPHCVREGEHRCTVYIRHGVTSRPATREEIGSLFQESGEIDFDLSPVPGAMLADLNMESIEEYSRSKLDLGLDELPIDVTQQLLNWKILVEQNGERKVTFTGMLFFGDRPGDFLPQTQLWLKRFRGLTTDEWYPGKEMDAPVPQAIEEAMEFIRLHTVLEKIRGLKRVQQAEYIEEVVREALVNGIAHRNYVRRGMRIRIFIFDDRIEVHSPGPLPNGVTVEYLRYGVQVTRNPNIMRYLRAFGYWEGDGLGVPRMIRLCRENGIREPDFTLVGDELVVTIYSREYERFHD